MKGSVTVDLALLCQNYETVYRGAQGREVYGVLKANAYGHGAIPCGQALSACGCRCFAVANLAEGVALRSSLPEGEILILGATPPKEGDTLARYRLSQCVFSPEYAKALSRALTHPVEVHWKLDTGMHRLGFPCGEERLTQLYRCAQLPRLHTVGIFSHFANGACVEESEKVTQRFAHSVQWLTDLGMTFSRVHLQNSAAWASGVGQVGNALRTGLLLYGYGSPMVRPIATWETEIVSVCSAKAGERVGYAPGWQAERDSRMGVLPIGYADGMLRSSVGGYVQWEGVQLPLVAVCMDMCMIDLSEHSALGVGSKVTLLGGKITAETWAQVRSTIPYEVLCHLGERQPRRYLCPPSLEKQDF